MFKSPPKSVEADLKDDINLECDVDGNPLEIVWVHAPAAEVSLKNNLSLIFSSVRFVSFYSLRISIFYFIYLNFVCMFMFFFFFYHFL